MVFINQIAALVGLSFKSLPRRRTSSLVIVIGIAGVVTVLLSVLTMASSLVSTIASVGQPDRATVLAKGASAEGASSIPRAAVQSILDAPGIKRSAGDEPLASAEVIATMRLRRHDGDAPGELVIRGVQPIAFEVRPELVLVEGRRVQSGLHELMVGRAARAQFQGLDIGSRVPLRGAEWTVVGLFSSGDARESELLADAETLLSAYKRNAYNAVTVRMESEQSLRALKDALTSDPTLSVDVTRETDYYRRQSRTVAVIFSAVAYAVGGIMAIGAMFGALNTMSSAVSARSAELATLRAIGFGPFSVVVAVLAETLLLALVGALLGAAIVWVAVSGNTFSTRQEDGQVIVQLRITWELVTTGILWAFAIGAIGGLVPAIRAARLPVAAALRES